MMKVKDMSWHLKALQKDGAGILAGNAALRDAALDVLADHKHTGLVLGVYDEEEPVALLVFENAEVNVKRALVLRKQKEKTEGSCKSVESEILARLRERLTETDAETAEYDGVILEKVKSDSKLAWLAPALMAAGFACLYYNVFQNRVAGVIFGLAIGACLGVPLYNRLRIKITETREEDQDAAKQ